MSIIALIPARGGSKGIPGKNLIPVAGKPLIAHSIACARAVPEISRVLVSTDSAQIADCARAQGAEAPFLRPAEISGDDTPMLAVLQHTLGWLRESGETVDGLVLLQPTSPLRTADSVAAAIRLFVSRQADSVVSVVPVPHNCTPGSLLKKDALDRVTPAFPEMNQAIRRQDKPIFYARNGPAILILRPSLIDSGRLYSENTVGFEMSRRESFDIDDREDLAIAEALLEFTLQRGREGTA
jgi:CMP-N,N'-diacetyllegionaminic acid synthase